jgi:hypothetical protein
MSDRSLESASRIRKNFYANPTQAVGVSALMVTALRGFLTLMLEGMRAATACNHRCDKMHRRARGVRINAESRETMCAAKPDDMNCGSGRQHAGLCKLPRNAGRRGACLMRVP